jgi:hypothetical protein
MSGRIHYEVGDLFAIELGAGYDVVTAHQVLHNLEAQRCLELLRRGRAALTPGGILAVLEPEQPAPGRRGSLIPTVGSLAFVTFTRHAAGPPPSCATSSFAPASRSSRSADRSSSQATSSSSADDLAPAEPATRSPRCRGKCASRVVLLPSEMLLTIADVGRERQAETLGKQAKVVMVAVREPVAEMVA